MHLAKTLRTAGNVIMLDEPTNDLDVETLEVLEAKLAEYSGTLIVVSHDREFLDNVVTSTIVFEEGGRLREYVGGYSDWLRHGHELAEVDRPTADEKSASAPQEATDSARPKKLSYHEQRELEQLPQDIDELEARLAELEGQVSATDFYAQGHEVTGPVLEAFSRTQAELDAALERWTELEDRVRAYRASRVK